MCIYVILFVVWGRGRDSYGGILVRCDFVRVGKKDRGFMMKEERFGDIV